MTDADHGASLESRGETRVLTRLLGGVVAVGAAVVAVAFAAALVGSGSADAPGFVVVGDPKHQGAQDVVVVAIDERGLVPIAGTVNGWPIDNMGVAHGVIVGEDIAIDVVAGDGGSAISASFRPGVPSTTEASAHSSIGAPRTPKGRVAYPVEGALPRSGSADVVVVDDSGVDVVSVSSADGYALPDGRRLRPSLDDVAVSVSPAFPDAPVVGGDVTCVVIPRGDGVVTVSVGIGGEVRALCRLRASAGEARRCTAAVVEGDDGAAVVCKAKADVTRLSRVSGLRRDELVAVDPRAEVAIERPEVKQALAAHLQAPDGRAVVISPSLEAQRAQRAEAAAKDAHAARTRFRVAALLLAAALTALAWSLTAARGTVVAGVAVVVLLLGAMDAALGVQRETTSTHTTTEPTTAAPTSTTTATTSGSP